MQFLTFFMFLSRFLRNKRDILLSLQRDYKTIMNITISVIIRLSDFMV